MPGRPSDLPEFADPPVVEVVLGVQFDPVREMRQSHFGLIWERLRADYPLTADHGRIEAPVTMLSGELPSFQLEVLDAPPTHRSWFISADDERVVQVQDDRVVHNWRHRAGQYPRFEPLLEQFWVALDAYRSALEAAGLEAPLPVGVEVTYINWIGGSTPAEFLRTLARAETEVAGVGSEPEVEHWLARYRVDDEGQDMAVGSLTIEVKPGARTVDGSIEHGYLLTLTYLGTIAAGSGDDRIRAQLERGRDVIVRSFADVTEPTMHGAERWGRI